MDVPSKVPATSGSSYSVAENTTTSCPKTIEPLPMLGYHWSAEGMGSQGTKVLARKVKTLSAHEEIVDRIVQSQIAGLTVDETSRLAMAEALEFAGIDTLEQVESLNLRIIPPGPIIHTWYARYNTGLFDGKNNPPHVKGLDYVTRISEQADRLKEWGIPVILVYLERDMPSLELEKMKKIFCEHENILVMSLESDLSSLKYTEYYKRKDAKNLLDDPRYSLCREFPELLLQAQRKAELVGKRLLSHNLVALGGLSVIYSDIDNTFLCKPMFQLAMYGVRNVCPFRKEFSLQDDKIFKKYLDDSMLSEIAQRHKEIFSHEGVIARKKERLLTGTLKDRAKRLYEYLLSGEALHNYRHLEPELDNVGIFHHEPPGYMAVNKDALAVVCQQFDDLPGYMWKEALLDKQNLNDQLLNLHGLQQVGQIHIGRDMTWKST